MPDPASPADLPRQWYLRHLAAVITLFAHPRLTFKRITALWRDLVNGATVIDTSDPQDRWPVVLRTSIQLDGDILTIVEQRWLAVAGTAERDVLALAHAAQVATRADPLVVLRQVQTATWYLACSVALAFSTMAIIWRADPWWLATNLLAAVVPLILRRFTPRVLRWIVHARQSWLAEEFHTLSKADIEKLILRRARRVGTAATNDRTT
jgi:hypothetical protein